MGERAIAPDKSRFNRVKNSPRRIQIPLLVGVSKRSAQPRNSQRVPPRINRGISQCPPGWIAETRKPRAQQNIARYRELSQHGIGQIARQIDPCIRHQQLGIDRHVFFRIDHGPARCQHALHVSAIGGAPGAVGKLDQGRIDPRFCKREQALRAGVKPAFDHGVQTVAHAVQQCRAGRDAGSRMLLLMKCYAPVQLCPLRFERGQPIGVFVQNLHPPQEFCQIVGIEIGAARDPLPVRRQKRDRGNAAHAKTLKQIRALIRVDPYRQGVARYRACDRFIFKTPRRHVPAPNRPLCVEKQQHRATEHAGRISLLPVSPGYLTAVEGGDRRVSRLIGRSAAPDGEHPQREDDPRILLQTDSHLIDGTRHRN